MEPIRSQKGKLGDTEFQEFWEQRGRLTDSSRNLTCQIDDHEKYSNTRNEVFARVQLLRKNWVQKPYQYDHILSILSLDFGKILFLTSFGAEFWLNFFLIC